MDELLRLSQMSRVDMHLRQVDLSAQVMTAAEDLQRREPQRRSRFLITHGVKATADPYLIGTVLENLLGNAWKFTSRRDETVIEFGTIRVPDAEVCCFVRDNGAGFNPAHAQRLFQPFQRLHTAEDFPGSGIGLASVRRIVERHDGRTWAEGHPGRGATVYFTLNAGTKKELWRVGLPSARPLVSPGSTPDRHES
jgi:light-regulated signal transduction histidine kinase (bacteriophytochrome)